MTDDALHNDEAAPLGVLLEFQRRPPRNVDAGGDIGGDDDPEAVAKDLASRVARINSERDRKPITAPDLAHFQALVELFEKRLEAQMRSMEALHDRIGMLERHMLGLPPAGGVRSGP
jgi:hypothetical protein